jgi:hypothetical protein
MNLHFPCPTTLETHYEAGNINNMDITKLVTKIKIIAFQ